METLLVETVVVAALSLTLFIYLGNRILGFFKSLDTARLKQGARNFYPSPSNPKTRRRKIETKANIICSLPIHQAARPEAPLS